MELTKELLDSLKQHKFEHALELVRENGDSYGRELVARYVRMDLPPAYEPSEYDIISTKLVGGISKIYDRNAGSREETRAMVKLSRYQNAVAFVERAQSESLMQGFDLHGLRKELEETDKKLKKASEDFKKQDHELCINKYNAWRMANK